MRYLIILIMLTSCVQRPISDTIYFAGRKEVIKKYIPGNYDLVCQVVDDCYGNHDTCDVTYAGGWMLLGEGRMTEGDKFGDSKVFKWKYSRANNRPVLKFRDHQKSVHVYTETIGSYSIGGWVPIVMQHDTLVMHKLMDDGYHSPTIIKNFYKKIN